MFFVINPLKKEITNEAIKDVGLETKYSESTVTVDLKPKDIVFVKEGSYRVGDVAMLSPYDTEILLNHHSLVFRVVKEDKWHTSIIKKMILWRLMHSGHLYLIDLCARV